MPRVATHTSLALAGTLALTACGSTGEQSPGANGSAQSATLAVTTSFYPLALAAERIGGEHVTVTNLTKPGAEPHDLELTPQDVAQISKAGLVVYLKGFQPAVDEAVQTQASTQALDVTSAARLTIAASQDEHGHEGETPQEHGEHGEEMTQDPHFWLDPTRYADVATAIASQLATKDPAHATAYQQNAKSFTDALTALDSELTAGLKTCASKELVTGHAAFAYLADRYGLEQEGIAGISPDAEPDAATMKAIVEHVKGHAVTTVYAETLVSPALAQTIANETGATVAVLDPIEGLSDSSAGKDYFEIMRSNLATLKKGQGCS
jgi:zinc transport system substrate-binding protein